MGGPPESFPGTTPYSQGTGAPTQYLICGPTLDTLAALRQSVLGRPRIPPPPIPHRLNRTATSHSQVYLALLAISERFPQREAALRHSRPATGRCHPYRSAPCPFPACHPLP